MPLRSLNPGNLFGGYEILEIAGVGAMATTYRARRIADSRLVALKIPLPRCLANPGYVLRFLQEAHLGQRLNNPFIVQIFESGEEQELPFISMEFLEGMTLKDALTASARIPEKRALQIAHDISGALEHAHSKGVVHRDLKPDNIMLRVGVGLKIMDFGIAKMMGEIGMTTDNMFIGSPLYGAPEMIDSKSVDHRVDLYSLGIMLFEMLQGFPPFSGTSPVAVLLEHRNKPIPKLKDLPVEVSKQVWSLVEILTEKDPNKRLPDARSLRLAIELLQKQR